MMNSLKQRASEFIGCISYLRQDKFQHDREALTVE